MYEKYIFFFFFEEEIFVPSWLRLNYLDKNKN